jgi:hypothetical protein
MFVDMSVCLFVDIMLSLPVRANYTVPPQKDDSHTPMPDSAIKSKQDGKLYLYLMKIMTILMKSTIIILN